MAKFEDDPRILRSLGLLKEEKVEEKPEPEVLVLEEPKPEPKPKAKKKTRKK